MAWFLMYWTETLRIVLLSSVGWVASFTWTVARTSPASFVTYRAVNSGSNFRGYRAPWIAILNVFEPPGSKRPVAI